MDIISTIQILVPDGVAANLIIDNLRERIPSKPSVFPKRSAKPRRGCERRKTSWGTEARVNKPRDHSRSTVMARPVHDSLLRIGDTPCNVA